MTDLKYILETLLLLAIPVAPVAAGLVLRRKFAAAESAPPMTGAHKAGRLAGNILFWGGLAGILFMIIVLLNFQGRI